MTLFALVGLPRSIPLLVFAGLVAGIFAVLSVISNRNSRAQDRLDRISRPASLAEIEDPKSKKDRLPGLMETAKALSKPLMPQTELEQSELQDQAGQRRLPQRLGRGRLPRHALRHA